MVNKLNNKGFTLVELLAVFVILISVSFVAVGGITSSLERREEKEIEEIETLSISGAKIYFSLLNSGSSDTCVSVLELVDGGYFSTNRNIKLDDYMGYTVRIEDNTYKFSDTQC